jgi:hypothetical protein
MEIQSSLLFEIINILFALTLLVIFKKYFKIETSIFIILLIHFLLIFLTNNVLFPVSYMGDQNTYLTYSEIYRQGLESTQYVSPSSSVFLASKIFAFFPIPLVNSVYSLSIINFIIYCVTYIILKKANVFTRISEFFYLLYPSLALYSALALRDTMILFFMILFFYFLLRKKRLYLDLLFAVLSALPLMWLKNQNAFLLLIVLVVYILLNFKKYNKIFILVLLIGFLGTLFFFQRYFSLYYLNFLRLYFFVFENGGRLADFRLIHSWSELLLVSVRSLFPFVLEPLPWKAEGILQLFQSFENIGILAIFIIFLRKKITRRFNKVKFLMIFYFIVSMAVYSLIIFNYGTAARYRFTFVVTFFIFYSFAGNQPAPVPVPLKMPKLRLVDS